MHDEAGRKRHEPWNELPQASGAGGRAGANSARAARERERVREEDYVPLLLGLAATREESGLCGDEEKPLPSAWSLLSQKRTTKRCSLFGYQMPAKRANSSQSRPLGRPKHWNRFGNPDAYFG